MDEIQKIELYEWYLNFKLLIINKIENNFLAQISHIINVMSFKHKNKKNEKGGDNQDRTKIKSKGGVKQFHS